MVYRDGSLMMTVIPLHVTRVSVGIVGHHPAKAGGDGSVVDSIFHGLRIALKNLAVKPNKLIIRLYIKLLQQYLALQRGSYAASNVIS